MSVSSLIKESGAHALLMRAVELDNDSRYAEAFTAYHSGVEQLMPVLKGVKDPTLRNQLRDKITSYIERAEALRKFIDRQDDDGKYHEEFQIENDSVGHSYWTVFGKYIDSFLTEVTVEDPYIRSNHQIYNFLRFCEMLVSSEARVKRIHLITGQDDNPSVSENQSTALKQLASSLKSRGILFSFEYSQSLHDREIRFNNGWIIKIGRGLDYFKAAETKYSIGFCDMSLRRCHETTVNVFNSKHTRTAAEQTSSDRTMK